MLKKSRAVIFLLWGLAAISCQRKEITLHKAYHDLAIKLSPIRHIKPVSKFTSTDFAFTFSSFENFLNRFVLEKLSPKPNDTPEALAEKLDNALEVMQGVIRKHDSTLADSLNDLIFFMALSDLNSSSDSELLDDATTADFIAAYSEFWPMQVKYENRKIENNYLWDFLKLSLKSPSKYSEQTPEQMAFAKIRSSIIAEKLYRSLTERQTLLMKTNLTAFIQTLNDEQAKLYEELAELK